jgi:hypothetical protein
VQRPRGAVRRRLRRLTTLEKDGEDFAYVLVTNEYDPARLAAACDNRRASTLIFRHVVQVNPDGPRRPTPPRTLPATCVREGGAGRTLAHADSGRLSSLAVWAASLANPRHDDCCGRAEILDIDPDCVEADTLLALSRHQPEARDQVSMRITRRLALQRVGYHLLRSLAAGPSLRHPVLFSV